ncbi:hypothetical protein [Qipengyuania atrilutea]|uniref:Uncharacterized protein n=1 Tax=Qipengyuania atrilutea TaxID=2744473 RepID=A0A850H396_9SPHN|nr:hypothetical protein [Actirhodobacter atriluteus]NVD45037.1 hypothetical protein [Actirhodobacter atriluteus]
MSLQNLQQTLKAGGCNQADQVILLIEECLRTGVAAGTDIVSAVAALGYNKQYVGLTLNQHTGSMPKQHYWFKTANGDYNLHE